MKKTSILKKYTSSDTHTTISGMTIINSGNKVNYYTQKSLSSTTQGDRNYLVTNLIS